MSMKFPLGYYFSGRKGKIKHSNKAFDKVAQVILDHIGKIIQSPHDLQKKLKHARHKLSHDPTYECKEVQHYAESLSMLVQGIYRGIYTMNTHRADVFYTRVFEKLNDDELMEKFEIFKDVFRQALDPAEKMIEGIEGIGQMAYDPAQFNQMMQKLLTHRTHAIKIKSWMEEYKKRLKKAGLKYYG